MVDTVASQLYSLFIFFITGITIGIFFDVFRIFRKAFKTSNLLTYIEDILFWIITGVFFIIILFRFNSGELRSYVVIGLILGLTLYMLTISKYFIKINVSIICFIKKIIAYPIKLVINVYKKIIKVMYMLFDKTIRRIFKPLFKPLSFIVINVRKSIKVSLNEYLKRVFKVTKTNKKHKKIQKNNRKTTDKRRILQINVEKYKKKD